MERKHESATTGRPGPRGGRRGGKDGEARLYTGAKVARVLAKLGVDFREFVAAYDADSSRVPRGTALTEEERAAVERFLKHRQIAELAQELGCSIATAHARVTKFVLLGPSPARRGAP